MAQKRSILVGMGSVGKLHFQSMTDLGLRVDVVDPFLASIDSPGNGWLYKSLGDLAGNEAEYNYAVVANWGPDHFRTIQSLISLGVSRFLIEKPVSTSFSELRSLEDMVGAGQIAFRTNWTKKAQGISEYLKRLDELPSSIYFHGGALCLSTNGIHWLELAMSLFQEVPESVTADVSIDYINPRSENLGFVDGVATWKFPSGRRFSVILDNHSSMAGTLEINYRDERLVLGQNNVIERQLRNPVELDSDRRVTRVGMPLKDEDFLEPRFLTYETAITKTHQEILKLRDLNDKQKMRHDLNVSKWLIAALMSSELSSQVSSENLEKLYWKETYSWPIS